MSEEAEQSVYLKMLGDLGVLIDSVKGWIMRLGVELHRAKDGLRTEQEARESMSEPSEKEEECMRRALLEVYKALDDFEKAGMMRVMGSIDAHIREAFKLVEEAEKLGKR
jgi:hypothetical protein